MSVLLLFDAYFGISYLTKKPTEKMTIYFVTIMVKWLNIFYISAGVNSDVWIKNKSENN